MRTNKAIGAVSSSVLVHLATILLACLCLTSNSNGRALALVHPPLAFSRIHTSIGRSGKSLPHYYNLHELQFRFPPPLAATFDSDDPDPRPSNDSPLWASLAMIGLPLLSGIFPWLLQWARSLPPNSVEQLQVVTALFVSNRIYLYANAAIIVALAGIRGSTVDSSKLGQRITDLTEELLYRPDLTVQKIQADNDYDGTTTGNNKPKQEEIIIPKPELIQSLTNSGIQETLDAVSADRQALILPILVSALLAVSVFLVPFWTNNSGIAGDMAPPPSEVASLLKSVLPYISQIWNAGLLVLFTRAELRRLFQELIPRNIKDNNNDDDDTILPFVEWGLAAGVTGVACLTPLWPVQNFVNMALAIAVSRAIQLDRFAAVVGALCLLTLYDASSVFLIPSASTAVEATMSASSASSSSLADSAHLVLLAEGNKAFADSAMGSVALQKLTSGTFQPGMLVTKVDDRFLGGSLGLGDSVFPSLLAIFARRFDLDQQQLVTTGDDTQPRFSLFGVSMVGFLLGCTACEFVPAVLATTGLPALVFIIPTMLVSVLAAASLSGELQALVEYQPTSDGKI